MIILAVGSSGPEVGNLQRFLAARDYTDFDHRPITVDERFGPRTGYALGSWQKGAGLDDTGVFGLESRAKATLQGFIPFVPARNFTQLWPLTPRKIRIVVIHVMESSEENTKTAENVANYFATQPKHGAIDLHYRPDGKPFEGASCHYNVDRDSIVQSVRESDVAWHAPGANADGIGVEHAGYSAQSAKDWGDEASTAILKNGARLVRELCLRYAIPMRRLSVEDLAGRRESGIVGHVDCTNAFTNGRGHYDPGLGYPWERYLKLVRDEEIG